MNELVVDSTQLHKVVDEIYRLFYEDKQVVVSVKPVKGRTLSQNKALHLYFELLADKLNASNFSIVPVVKEFRDDAEIPWTKEAVKDLLWRPIQKSQFTTLSTSDLKVDQISRIYDILNRFISSKYGIFVAFPEAEHDQDRK